MSDVDFLMILVSIFFICLIILLVGLINPQLVIKWGEIEKRTRKKVILYYGLSALILYIIVRLSAINMVNNNINAQNVLKSSTSNQTNISSNSNELIKVTPKELSDAYNNNQVNAESKYKGKTAIITGKILDIGVYDGKPVIGLVNSDNKYEVTFSDVKCYFSDTSQNNKISNLSKGQTITIKGVIDGYGMSVLMDNCTLQ